MHTNYLTQDDAAEEELNAGEQALKGGDADEATGLGGRDGDPNIAADAEAAAGSDTLAAAGSGAADDAPRRVGALARRGPRADRAASLAITCVSSVPRTRALPMHAVADARGGRPGGFARTDWLYGVLSLSSKSAPTPLQLTLDHEQLQSRIEKIVGRVRRLTSSN